MTETVIIGLSIASNLFFLCLGFWMGRLSSNQAIPRIQMPLKKKALHNEFQEDPFNKAMRPKPEERKETL